jgi:hypothetical protein
LDQNEIVSVKSRLPGPKRLFLSLKMTHRDSKRFIFEENIITRQQ